MYVHPDVLINIYFAPDVPKVWDLQSRPIDLLFFSLFQSYKHFLHRASTHVCVMHDSSNFVVVCTFICWLIEGLIDYSQLIKIKTVAPHFWQNPPSPISKIPLYAKLLYVFPLYHHDCNKKKQLATLDYDTWPLLSFTCQMGIKNNKKCIWEKKL